MTHERRHALVKRYDDLRGRVLERPSPSAPGRGLAIILDRGLTSWMEAWTLLPERRTYPEHPRTTAKDEIPRDHERKLVRVMAAMVLGAVCARKNPCEGASHAF